MLGNSHMEKNSHFEILEILNYSNVRSNFVATDVLHDIEGKIHESETVMLAILKSVTAWDISILALLLSEIAY